MAGANGNGRRAAVKNGGRNTAKKKPEPGVTPPSHDLEAEASVLGVLLLQGMEANRELADKRVAELLRIVRPEHFYNSKHQRIFDGIFDLIKRGDPVDPLTLADELEKREQIADVGGRPYIHTLIAGVPHSGNAKWYAKTVRDCYRQRTLQEATLRATQALASKSGDVNAIARELEKATRAITTVPALLAEASGGPQLSALLDETVEQLERWVVFQNVHQSTTLALWIAHTYVTDAADTSPYLHITSPEPRCGKSRLLEVAQLMVWKPEPMVSPTEAVIYRLIQEERPTILLDEVDTIFGKDPKTYEALRCLLNAGNRRGTVVPRMGGGSDGKSMKIERFNVFGPKILAGIGELPSTVADRSVRIQLARRLRDQHVDRFRVRQAEAATEALRQRLSEWSSFAIDALMEMRPSVPPGLDDRAADGWEPLFAIADLAGEDWGAAARLAALTLSEARPDETSLGVRLLGDIRRVFAERSESRLPTEDLLEVLVQIEDSPWGQWWGLDVDRNHYKGPSGRLAKMLGRYAIRPTQFKVDQKKVRGYELASFGDAFDHYLTEGEVPFTPPEKTVPRYAAGQGPDSASEPLSTVPFAKGPLSREVPSVPSISGGEDGTSSNDPTLLDPSQTPSDQDVPASEPVENGGADET